MTGYNLVNFVRAIVERLMLNNCFKKQELTLLLNSVRSNLSTLHDRHDHEVPVGSEATRDLLLESLELYDQSIGEVLAFTESLDETHLMNAVALADEAHDVVLAVEDVIQQNQRLLQDTVVT